MASTAEAQRELLLDVSPSNALPAPRDAASVESAAPVMPSATFSVGSAGVSSEPSEMLKSQADTLGYPCIAVTERRT